MTDQRSRIARPGRPRIAGTLAVALALALAAALLVGTAANAAGAPTVSSVAPNIGSFLGGTAVTITGSGFVAGATVEFNGVAATGVNVVSATQITATTPADVAGPATVKVINADLQASTLTGGFTYLGPAPTIAGVAPPNGGTNGGDTITITGTNLLAGLTVTVGGVATTSIVVVSATQVTAVTPAGSAGVVDVVVTAADTQSVTSGGAYTYVIDATPTVTSVSPASGTTGGGTRVTITGTDFAAGATVTFGGVAATAVTFVSTTTLTATTPAGTAGAQPVAVSNPDSQTATRAGAYSYIDTPAPTVTAVSPDSGPLAGGSAVTITGTGFLEGIAVLFGSKEATNVVVVSAVSITATAPDGTGTVAIKVTNTDGDTETLAAAYTYLPAPTITSITPDSGSEAGKTVVTIAGTGFQDGATVTIGTLATGVVFDSATKLTATTAARAPGVVSVVVTNPDGQVGTLATAYTYLAAPVIADISPLTGTTLGGTAVTITGTGFNAGVTVSFGETAVEGATLTGSTVITLTTPAGAEGVVRVTVTNPDGIAGFRETGFIYQTIQPSFTTGSVPAQGWGLVVFSGGSTADLVVAAVSEGCDPAQMIVAATDTAGKFITLVPTAPAFVNTAWDAFFAEGMPVGQILFVRCA